MLQLLFTVAFSAAPLMLYIPPVRSLNLFLQTTEFLLRGAVSHAFTVCPRLRRVISRFLSLRLAAARRQILNVLDARVLFVLLSLYHHTFAFFFFPFFYLEFSVFFCTQREEWNFLFTCFWCLYFDDRLIVHWNIHLSSVFLVGK